MEIFIDVTLRKRIKEDEEDHPNVVREREREVITKILHPLLDDGWEIVIPLTRVEKS